MSSSPRRRSSTPASAAWRRSGRSGRTGSSWIAARFRRLNINIGVPSFSSEHATSQLLFSFFVPVAVAVTRSRRGTRRCRGGGRGGGRTQTQYVGEGRQVILQERRVRRCHVAVGQAV